MTPDEINGLAQAASRGDRQSFEQLVSEFTGNIRGYVRVRGVRSSDVDDAIQEIWLVAWDHLQQGGDKSFDPRKGGFYTWLTECIARGKATKYRPKPRDEREAEVGQVIGKGARGLSMEDAERFLELFRLLFACGGYPHQQLAFGFARHLDSNRSDRGVQGDPTRVAQELAKIPLRELTGMYLKEYVRQSISRGLEPQLKEYLAPLFKRLDLPVRLDARIGLVWNQREAALSEGSVERTVGETCMEDYAAAWCGSNLVKAITDWSNKVSRRLFDVIDGGFKACVHCKLAWIPPHDDEAQRNPESSVLRERSR